MASAAPSPNAADATATARAQIRKLHRAPEPDVLAPLLRDAALDSESRRNVENRALGMLAELRRAQSSGWVNQFLQEYRLNTSEGIALLSLAEAFLRVPDPQTADDLIADKLGNADWRAHKGKSHSTLVNSATWGLVIGRALVSETEQASSLKRLLTRAGEPFVRQAVGAAMRMMGEIFVMGRTIEEAIGRMKKRENRGFTASFVMMFLIGLILDLFSGGGGEASYTLDAFRVAMLVQFPIVGFGVVMLVRARKRTRRLLEEEQGIQVGPLWVALARAWGRRRRGGASSGQA